MTAYVTYDNQFLTSGLVTPINTRTNTAGPTISVGRDPEAIAITPNGRTVYVVSYDTGAVTPISTRTNTAGSAIRVEGFPEALSIAPNGATAYIVSVGAGGEDLVTPIITRTDKAGPPIAVAPEPGAIAITTGSCLPVPSRMCHPLEKGLEGRNG